MGREPGPSASLAAGRAEGGKGKANNQVSHPHKENSSWMSAELRKPATASPPQTGRVRAALPRVQGQPLRHLLGPGSAQRLNRSPGRRVGNEGERRSRTLIERQG